MGGFLTFLLMVGGIGGLVLFAVKKTNASWVPVFAKAAEINRQSGTSFPTDMTADELVMGSYSTRDTVMLFDDKSKKVLLVTGKGKNFEVKDFSYFSRWQLLWTEKPGRIRPEIYSVRIEFSTNDLKRPNLKVPVKSKEHGDAWNSRLSILFQ